MFWTNHIKPSKGRSLSAKEIAEIDLSKVLPPSPKPKKSTPSFEPTKVDLHEEWSALHKDSVANLMYCESGETVPESLERREFFARVPSRFMKPLRNMSLVDLKQYDQFLQLILTTTGMAMKHRRHQLNGVSAKIRHEITTRCQ